MQLTAIRNTLREIQTAKVRGTLDDLDAAILELDDLLERAGPTLLPSTLTLWLIQELDLYCTSVLPALPGLAAPVRQELHDHYTRRIESLRAQFREAARIEAALAQLFFRLNQQQIASVDQLLEALGAVYGWPELQVPMFQHPDRLTARFEAMYNAFTAPVTKSCFSTLFTYLPADVRQQFEPGRDLFWEQVAERFQPKAVLVNPLSHQAQLLRCDIVTTCTLTPPDIVTFADVADVRMKSSCVQALYTARRYLQEMFPEHIRGRFFHIQVQLSNPMAEYEDSSISLLLGVKVLGDLLHLACDPQTVITGAVDESGHVMPVEHLAAKILAIGEHPAITTLIVPEANSLPSFADHVEQGQTLRLVPVQTFSETVQIYYGEDRIRRLRQRQDWGDAPDVPVFVGRTKELAALAAWMLRDRCRVIAIVGLKGVGKTRLSVAFGKGGIGKTDLSLTAAREMQQEFDLVWWRSLLNAPEPGQICTELLTFLSNQQIHAIPDTFEEQISLLLHYLHVQRCLVILDNLESVLQGSELSSASAPASRAGQWRAGYEGYGRLFHRLGEVPHQSCVLLTSRETPADLTPLAGPDRYVRVLELGGLTDDDAKALFSTVGVFSGSDAAWQAVLAAYQGNPLALELAARVIQEQCQGNLDMFVRNGPPSSHSLYELLDWHVNRLSDREYAVLLWLAIHREPTTADRLAENLLEPTSPEQAQSILQALQRRLPLETHNDQVFLQPVLVEYLTRRLIQQIGDELLTGDMHLLNSHALLETSAKEFVRLSQRRLIMTPLLSWSSVHLEKMLTDLLTTLREEALAQPGEYVGQRTRTLLHDLHPTITAVLQSRETLDAQLRHLLAALRQHPSHAPGYAAGNLLNLLVQLGQGTLRDVDCSDLAVWQADLKGIEVVRGVFRHAQFRHAVFTQDFGSISSVAFTPDGQYFVTGDSIGNVRLSQVKDGHPVQLYAGHTDFVRKVAVSPDGRWIASGGDDRTVRLWDKETGVCLHTFHGHQGRVLAVAFHPEQSLLASIGDDPTLRLWQCETGGCAMIFEAHPAGALALAFHPDGQLLASGGTSIKFWNLVTGTCVRTLLSQQFGARTIIFHPDGQRLISCDGESSLRIWTVRNGACLTNFIGHHGALWALALSADGQWLASGGDDRTIRFWEMSSGRCLTTITGLGNRVSALAFHPAGQIVASSSDEPVVRLWEVPQGSCLSTLHGYTNRVWAIAFHPQKQILATGSDDRHVRLWDLRPRTCQQIFHGHTHRVVSVAFSPDGHLLASSSDDARIILWDIISGTCRHTLHGHAVGVRCVAFHPDGHILASSGDDGSIRLWKVRTGEELTVFQGHTDWVRTVAFHPNGDILASGGNDRLVKLWDIATGECLRTIQGNPLSVRTAAFGPDGHWLIIAGDDPVLRLWDFQQSDLQEFQDHTNWIMSVAVSPDGQWITSGGYDRTVKLWEVASRQVRDLSPAPASRVRMVQFSPDGHLLASGCADGTINLWNIPAGSHLTTITLPRPYDNMDITGVTGISQAQHAVLTALGAITREENHD